MESLARLVLIIFLAIYTASFVAELAVLLYTIKYFFPTFGGWWYLIWVPLLLGINWLFSVLILILLTKIGSKS